MSFETLCHNSPITLSEIYTGFFCQEWNMQSMKSSATILKTATNNFTWKFSSSDFITSTILLAVALSL